MTRLFDLTDNVIVVTGGNVGIGRGITEALASSGAKVVIVGRDAATLKEAAASLSGLAGEVTGTVCDVSDDAQVGALFDSVAAKYGRLDAAFANAGVSTKPTKVADFSPDDWREVAAVNVEGVLSTFAHASRHMIAFGQGGSLVATSSLTAVHGAPYNSSYSATKSAVLGIVRSAAVELGRYGIRANALVPGWIETGLTSDLLSSEGAQSKVLPRVPLRRWGQPSDIGGPAVFLASHASGYVSGASIVIDGAYSIA